MVLQPRGCGRVGRRRTFFPVGPPACGWPYLHFGPLSVHIAQLRLRCPQAARTPAPGLSAPAPRVVRGGDVRCPHRRRRRLPRPPQPTRSAWSAGSPRRPRSGCCPAATPCGRSGWWSPRPAGRSRSRQTVDALECAAWSARARRSVAAWAADDVVEVVGSLRRRFFRAGGAVGVPGGGRDERRAGSSVAQRADEHPDAGLGLERRRLLRQQPVGGRDAEHLLEVRRRHQHRDAVGPPTAASASSTAWWCPIELGARREARDQVLVQHLDRGPVRADVDRERDPGRGRRSPTSRSGASLPSARRGVGGLPADPGPLGGVLQRGQRASGRAPGGSRRGTAVCRPGRRASPGRRPWPAPGSCCCIRR